MCSRTLHKEFVPPKNYLPFARFLASRWSSLDKPYTIESVDQLFDTLKFLSQQFELRNISGDIPDAFCRSLVRLEQHVFEEQTKQLDPFTDVIMTATSTYVYLFLRQIPMNAGIYLRLTPKIQASLEVILTDGSRPLSGNEYRILLWTAFMGTIPTRGALCSRKPSTELENSRSWWIKQLCEIGTILRLDSVSDFEQVLVDVVNLTVEGKQWCKILWSEMETSHDHAHARCERVSKIRGNVS